MRPDGPTNGVLALISSSRGVLADVDYAGVVAVVGAQHGGCIVERAAETARWFLHCSLSGANYKTLFH